MNIFNFRSLSISKRLTMLVLFCILPAIFILLYSDLELRRHQIEEAQENVAFLAHAMAMKQQEITLSAKQALSTLAEVPGIQNLDIQSISWIMNSVLTHNPRYLQISLIDLQGNILATSGSATSTTASDSKHFREALELRKFSAGEFVISESGNDIPVFHFAYPVLDSSGNPKALLDIGISLADFSTFHEASKLPEKSFLAVTDHRGIRLYYYPSQQATNPIGKAINPENWKIASKKRDPGILISKGTDGLDRIFAYEPLSLSPKDEPYMYVWAAIPQTYILAHANTVLARNLFLLILAILTALLILRIIGKNTIIAPIRNLVDLAEKYSAGNLEARSGFEKQPAEFKSLIRAFHDMAQALDRNQKILRESEARFRHLMNSLDALVYVTDMETYEVLFINDYGKRMLGDITGKICWQSIQQGQVGPCDFCTNKYLIDEKGKPKGVYTWEFQNTVTGKWFDIHDRAIIWTDGRIVRLEIATDITDRKETELAKDDLIKKLEKASSEINSLRGILPICSFCKKIRDDKGYWNQVEVYIKEHSEADFSHSLCPDCAKIHYPEYVNKDGKIKKK